MNVPGIFQSEFAAEYQNPGTHWNGERALFGYANVLVSIWYFLRDQTGDVRGLHRKKRRKKAIKDLEFRSIFSLKQYFSVR